MLSDGANNVGDMHKFLQSSVPASKHDYSIAQCWINDCNTVWGPNFVMVSVALICTALQ